MKAISKFLLLGAVSCPHSLAQDTKDPVCFIRVVNAISQGTGPAYAKVDGADLRAAGYDLGDATGGNAVKVGSHKVVFKREGLEDASTNVTLEKNQTVTLIPFGEKVPATDQKPAYIAIRVLRLKQMEPEGGRTATFVSVSATPELKAEVRDEKGKWSTVFVKHLGVSQMPLIYTQGYAPVKVAEKPVDSIPIGGVGNYVIVLYDDLQGNVRSLYFRDYKFLSPD